MMNTQSTVLSLRVSTELASKFKVEAARRNMKQNSLFEEIFRIYQEKSESRDRNEKGDGNG